MAVSSDNSDSGSAASSASSRRRSAVSVSACALTETYSPIAIAIAPALSAATPAVRMAFRLAPEAATPTSSAAVDTRPSSAPSTAALNQPERPDRCRSKWGSTGEGYSAYRVHWSGDSEPDCKASRPTIARGDGPTRSSTAAISRPREVERPGGRSHPEAAREQGIWCTRRVHVGRSPKHPRPFEWTLDPGWPAKDSSHSRHG